MLHWSEQLLLTSLGTLTLCQTRARKYLAMTIRFYIMEDIFILLFYRFLFVLFFYYFQKVGRIFYINFQNFFPQFYISFYCSYLFKESVNISSIVQKIEYFCHKLAVVNITFQLTHSSIFIKYVHEIIFFS